MAIEYTKINPGVFKPTKEGESIEGKLLSIEDSKKFKEGGKIYHLETADGGQIVVFGTTVLSDRMSFVNIGEQIKIIYMGVKKNAKGQDTKIFEVYKGKVKI
jgi:hypothetical protein